jgi:putative tricarboxylic transport membrane protein
MEALQNLLYGFSFSLTLPNLIYCFIGVLLGQIVGILPGLGASGTVALLLPFTFFLDEISAIIMVAGIYYGTMYGGSITSILMRIPGEAASVITCLDGYEMGKKGRAGAALGVSAFGSFFAGTLGIIGLMLIAPPLADFSLKFGPAEYFALAFLGLTLVTQLGGGAKIKAVLMVILGLLLSTIGLDPIRSAERFSFGTLTLLNGLHMVPIAMGLFGISEVFSMVMGEDQMENDAMVPGRFWDLFPSRNEWK